jgi:hypothetical protein
MTSKHAPHECMTAVQHTIHAEDTAVGHLCRACIALALHRVHCDALQALSSTPVACPGSTPLLAAAQVAPPGSTASR